MIVNSASLGRYSASNQLAGFGDVYDDLVAQVQTVNDAMYAAVANGDFATGATAQSAQQFVDNWNRTAAAWQGLAPQARAGTLKGGTDSWIALGQKLVSELATLDQYIDDTATMTVVENFIRDFPASLAAVTKQAINGALNTGKNIIDQTVNEGVKTVLLVGGALALVAYLISKSGASVNTKYVSIGKK